MAGRSSELWLSQILEHARGIDVDLAALDREEVRPAAIARSAAVVGLAVAVAIGAEEQLRFDALDQQHLVVAS